MAASTDTGVLVARLVADVTGLQRDMQRATKQLSTSTAKMNRSLASTDSKIKKSLDLWRSLRTGVVGYVGFMVGRFIRAQIDAAGALQDTAEKVGLNIERLQDLHYAARQFDLDNGVVDMALQRLSRRIGEAVNGQGELIGVLRQYNIRVTDASGKTRALDAIIGDLADTIRDAKDDQEALRIAFKAFDSEGAALVNVMRDGREGLQQYSEESKRAGRITAEQADQLRMLRRVLTNITEDIKTQLLVALADTITRWTLMGKAAVIAIDMIDNRLARFASDNAGILQFLMSVAGDPAAAAIVGAARTAGNAGLLTNGPGAPGAANPNPLSPAGVGGTAGGGTPFGPGAPGGSGPPEAADPSYVARQKKTSEMIIEIWRKQWELRRDMAMTYFDFEKYQRQQRVQSEQRVESEILSLRQVALQSAVGLLQTLGSEHKGAAIATLAIQKALAIKEVLIQSQVAAMRALAELGPVAGAAAASKILLLGKVSAGFIAAQGLAEAIQISRGGGGAGLTSSQPLFTQSTTPVSAGGAKAIEAARGVKVTQVYVMGPIYSVSDFDRAVTKAIERETDRDVVIIHANSRQAAEIRRGDG